MGNLIMAYSAVIILCFSHIRFSQPLTDFEEYEKNFLNAFMATKNIVTKVCIVGYSKAYAPHSAYGKRNSGSYGQGGYDNEDYGYSAGQGSEGYGQNVPLQVNTCYDVVTTSGVCGKLAPNSIHNNDGRFNYIQFTAPISTCFVYEKDNCVGNGYFNEYRTVGNYYDYYQYKYTQAVARVPIEQNGNYGSRQEKFKSFMCFK